MARWRIGPVRVGGGRKASVSVGVGPFGATFGGRRRRTSSGSYVVDEVEGEPISPATWARMELQNLSVKLWSTFILVTLPVLWAMSFLISVFTLLLYCLLAAGSIALSWRQFTAWSRHRKAERSQTPTASQLKAWAKVEDGYLVEKLPLIGFLVRQRDKSFEKVKNLEISEDVPEHEQLPLRKIRRIPFWTMMAVNFVFGYFLILPLQLHFDYVNKDLLECPTEEAGRKLSVTQKTCQQLNDYLPFMYVAQVLVLLALFCAFVVALRSGAFMRLFEFLEEKVLRLGKTQVERLKGTYGTQIDQASQLKTRIGSSIKNKKVAPRTSEFQDTEAIRRRLMEKQNPSSS